MSCEPDITQLLKSIVFFLLGKERSEPADTYEYNSQVVISV